jgi:hypothetical protein
MQPPAFKQNLSKLLSMPVAQTCVGGPLPTFQDQSSSTHASPDRWAGPGGKCVASAVPSPSSLPVLVFVNILTCIITSKELVFGTAPNYGKESTKPTMAGYKDYTEKSRNMTDIIHPRATHPHNSIL